MLSHFPPHIGDHFRSQLAASSFSSPSLFEDEVLNRVMSESREDQSVSSCVSLAQAVSFPVFGAGKFARKASSDQASAAASPLAAPGGRGRGCGSDRGRGGGYKRKASHSPARGGKSPRGNSSRGKGFTK